MRYLLEHLDQLRAWALIAFVAPLWEWARVHFGGFWWSSPVVWLCIFWASDWVLGSARACYDGWEHPDDPARGWRASRAARSLLKLLTWLAVLGLAWGIRDSHVAFGGMPAGLLEVGVIVTEAGSVLAHLAAISGSPTLRFLASKLRQQTTGET